MPGGGFGRQAADAPAAQPSGPMTPNGALPGIEAAAAAPAAPSVASRSRKSRQDSPASTCSFRSADGSIASRPRAETSSFRPIPCRSLPCRDLASLAAVLVALLVVWLLGRESSRRAAVSLLNSTASGLALVILGLISVVSGILPLAGLLAIVIGLVITIRSRFCAAESRPPHKQVNAKDCRRVETTVFSDFGRIFDCTLGYVGPMAPRLESAYVTFSVATNIRCAERLETMGK